MRKCITCQKETKNPKYCSLSCFISMSNKLSPRRKLTRKCSKCNLIVKTKDHNLCEEHSKTYTQDTRKELEARILGEYNDKQSIKRLHASSRNAHVRLLARS